MRRQLAKLAALIDVERGDRLAVDDDDDLLRAGGGCRDRGGKHEKRGSHQSAECHETIEHHRSIRFLADAGLASAHALIILRSNSPLATSQCYRVLPKAPPPPVDGAPLFVVPPSVRKLTCIMIGMVDRHAAAVGIACNIIQGQDEAVVDVADADLSLGDRLGVEIIARPCQQHPVRVHLQPRASEDALAPVQEPDQGLGGIVAVHHRGRPPAECRGGLQARCAAG